MVSAENPLILAGLSLYVVLLTAIGLVAYRKVESSSDFMVADNSLGLVVSAGTFGATYFSAIGFVGLPALTYVYGWGPFIWLPVATLVGVAGAILVAVRYRRTPMNTVPEFFKLRYGSDRLQAFAALGMVYGILFALVAQVKGFATILAGVIGISATSAILLAVTLITIYTVLGGFYGVAWTDTIQWVVLSSGMLIVFLLVLGDTGGWNNLLSQAATITTPPVEGGTPTQRGALTSATAKGAYPWITIFMGLFLWGFGIASHPQYAIRFQSAKNAGTAVKGIMLGMVLVAPGLIFSAVAGIGIRVLQPTMTGGFGPDSAMVYYMLNYVPDILAIVILGAALSAILSTSDSELLLIGTAFANDIWHNLVNEDASDRQLLIANRLATIVFGIIVAYIAVTSPALVAQVGAYAWGVLAVFFFFPLLVGLYWKEANETGTWACLITGTLVTLGWALMGLPTETQIPPPVAGMLFGGAAFISVSYFTESPPESQWKPFVRPDEVQNIDDVDIDTGTPGVADD